MRARTKIRPAPTSARIPIRSSGTPWTSIPFSPETAAPDATLITPPEPRCTNTTPRKSALAREPSINNIHYAALLRLLPWLRRLVAGGHTGDQDAAIGFGAIGEAPQRAWGTTSWRKQMRRRWHGWRALRRQRDRVPSGRRRQNGSSDRWHRRMLSATAESRSTGDLVSRRLRQAGHGTSGDATYRTSLRCDGDYSGGSVLFSSVKSRSKRSRVPALRWPRKSGLVRSR